MIKGKKKERMNVEVKKKKEGKKENRKERREIGYISGSDVTTGFSVPLTSIPWDLNP